MLIARATQAVLRTNSTVVVTPSITAAHISAGQNYACDSAAKGGSGICTHYDGIVEARRTKYKYNLYPSVQECYADTVFTTLGATYKTFCYDCPAGQYSGVRSTAPCKKCPEGQFQANRGSTICHACPAGKFQLYEKHTECLKLLNLHKGGKARRHALIAAYQGKDMLLDMAHEAEAMQTKAAQVERTINRTIANEHKMVSYHLADWSSDERTAHFAIQRDRMNELVQHANRARVIARKAALAVDTATPKSTRASRTRLSVSAAAALKPVNYALSVLNRTTSADPKLRQFVHYFKRMQALLRLVRDRSRPSAADLESELDLPQHLTAHASNHSGPPPILRVAQAFLNATVITRRIVLACVSHEHRLAEEIRRLLATDEKKRHDVLDAMVAYASAAQKDISKMDPAQFGLKIDHPLLALQATKAHVLAVRHGAEIIGARASALLRAATVAASAHASVGSDTNLDESVVPDMFEDASSSGNAVDTGGGDNGDPAAASSAWTPVQALTHIEEEYDADQVGVNVRQTIDRKFMALLQQRLLDAKRRKEQLLWHKAKQQHEMLEESYKGHFSPGSKALLVLEKAGRTLLSRFRPQLAFGVTLRAGVRNATVTAQMLIMQYHAHPKLFPRGFEHVFADFERLQRLFQSTVSFRTRLAHQLARVRKAVSQVRDQLADFTTSTAGDSLNKAMISAEFSANMKRFSREAANTTAWKPFVGKVRATCTASGLSSLGDPSWDAHGLIGPGTS
eukprot:g5628.t1